MAAEPTSPVVAVVAARLLAGFTSGRTETPSKAVLIDMWPHRSENPRNSRRLLSQLHAALTPVRRPNILILLWRWRYELALLTGLPAAVSVLIHAIGAASTVVASTALICPVALWEPARRLAVAQAWCIITPHRVRTGCAQAWIHSRSGKIPVVLFTRPQPYGESVLLWCRAGTSPRDFFPARPLLTAACWARDVGITPDERHAQLVTLHIIRRDGWEWPSGPGDDATGPYTPPEPPAGELGPGLQ
ncbi:MAG TPA: hypothetical protein VGD68_07460 [Streptosporangiaceae bacterium]